MKVIGTDADGNRIVTMSYKEIAFAAGYLSTSDFEYAGFRAKPGDEIKLGEAGDYLRWLRTFGATIEKQVQTSRDGLNQLEIFMRTLQAAEKKEVPKEATPAETVAFTCNRAIIRDEEPTAHKTEAKAA